MPGVDRYVVTVAPALGDEITRMAHGNTATLDELDAALVGMNDLEAGVLLLSIPWPRVAISAPHTRRIYVHAIRVKREGSRRAAFLLNDNHLEGLLVPGRHKAVVVDA